MKGHTRLSMMTLLFPELLLFEGCCRREKERVSPVGPQWHVFFLNE